MATNHPEAQWFKGAGFGTFIHWGTYSVRGIEVSWPLMPHSPQHLDVDEYEALADQFNPERYNPEEWARIAKAAGARYAVLTTKHHDGYCLFDTATTDYSAPKTRPGRDLVRPYVEAFRNARLLKTGESLIARKQVGRIVIELPAEKCDEFNTVVALEFKEEPHWPAP